MKFLSALIYILPAMFAGGLRADEPDTKLVHQIVSSVSLLADLSEEVVKLEKDSSNKTDSLKGIIKHYALTYYVDFLVLSQGEENVSHVSQAAKDLSEFYEPIRKVVQLDGLDDSVEAIRFAFKIEAEKDSKKSEAPKE